MTNEEKLALADERARLEASIYRDRQRIQEIDERFRIDPEGEEIDFSGVVERLRAKGILPPKKG